MNPFFDLMSIGFLCAWVVGVLLLFRGMLGRRVGQEPRCRKCGYNLTGIVVDKCPECGGHATGEHVVIGERRRLWRWVPSGLFLVLVSTSVLGLRVYGRAKDINWYAYYPDFLILSMVESDDAWAISELGERLANGSVSLTDIVHLIPHALDQQSDVKAWSHVLAEADLTGLLNEGQHRQFLDQLVNVKLEMRSRIRQGERLHVMVSNWEAEAPGINCSYELAGNRLHIGNWSTRLRTRTDGDFSRTGGGGIGQEIETAALHPGAYRVEYPITKTYFCGTGEEWDKPSFSIKTTETAELEILPANAPDTVRLVSIPSLAGRFKNAITIRVSDKAWHGDLNTTAPLGHGLFRRQEGNSSILIPLATSVASVFFR